ncbi:Choline dehydrogenase, mitochondrial [Mycena sanguinolenta]|uniref:Choline dehydrogenase, mitochondrial n=1 Tax=Mycena sanguinolenta TaxID=230812 RepID=A0A8H6X8D0_9AGAR|nr:Choline dehydrogenase, mitochondrial [Mycena sanguinolenta]
MLSAPGLRQIDVQDRLNRQYTQPKAGLGDAKSHSQGGIYLTPLSNLSAHSIFQFPLGLGWPHQTINGAQRSSDATLLNLHVPVDARVTRVNQTGTDSAVMDRPFHNSFNAHSGINLISAKNEDVRSAGAVGTAQIFLSGIDPENDSSALGIRIIFNNPTAGQNLTDPPLRSNLWYVNSNGTFDVLD